LLSPRRPRHSIEPGPRGASARLGAALVYDCCTGIDGSFDCGFFGSETVVIDRHAVSDDEPASFGTGPSVFYNFDFDHVLSPKLWRDLPDHDQTLR